MRNIAVILAGGIGSRMGGREPKQYMTVAGRTVMEHSIAAFQRHPMIDGIAVVAAEAYHDRIAECVRRDGFTKVTRLLPGGKERHFSSLQAIRAYEGEDCNLLFHDAVRPLVSQAVITRVVEALREHGAVDVAVPATDTMVEVDERGRVVAVPARDRLRRVQTPQGFRREVIAEAYERALRDPNFTTTDDCGVVLRYMPEVEVVVVEGERKNIKLTYPEDIKWAEEWLSAPSL